MNCRPIALCCLLLALPGFSLAQDAGGLLVAVKGRVWVQPPGAEEYRARAGEQLAAGTRIRTGADGQAEIELEDGSTLVVRDRSSIQLSGIRRQKERKTSLLIFFGRVWNKISRAVGKQARYEIHTPVLVAGVRGTRFEAGVGDDGSVRIVVQEGVVAVTGDRRGETLHRDQEIEADADGLSPLQATPEQVNWYQWRAGKRDRLRSEGRKIVNSFARRIDSRREKLSADRARQKEIEGLRAAALAAAREGDPEAVEQVRRYNDELVTIADRIADLGDAAGSQFGLVNHFAELAQDPDFQMVEGDYVKAEAARMLRIKEEFDRMVAEGTDISMEAMEKMLQEMSDGRRGSLRFKKGSSAQDLWGDEQKETTP
ncbi:MAG: hypothetical protein AMJ54_09570 [Deltaproteobacteria bacterium SG8_13]|nr:MAG: hypothetical protein AMJ54_09570 [Deltaproteobacteria bacterium SG8_13]